MLCFHQVDPAVFPLFNAITVYATIVNKSMKYDNFNVRSAEDISDLFFDTWFPGRLISNMKELTSKFRAATLNQIINDIIF